ncbi:glycosyltransferase family 2 protein [Photobacterium lipolyticum]|uniref:Glycosyl transferase n=1 Tax=Photobacterium lipolyticum TaxID=266810 RepID=A0A2T3MV78_9GAMM|nr:glycosyltransferase family 2 protein [Photobacterium lipolyticum]PSW03866.1 glycosyl transferase [Photobacterium lipolyticum]
MKVSVITVSYNSQEFIFDSINSVNNQTYENLEHVIVDGGSSDNTMDIVYKLAKRKPIILSESDNGIYDAWNKALSLATGDVICFCNTDDFWPEDYIEVAMKTLISNEDSVVYGDVVMVSRENLIKSSKEVGYYCEKNIYRGFNFRTTSIFVSKSIFDFVGLFDVSFKIAGDSDWLLRAKNKGICFTHANHTVYMRDGGISNEYESTAFKEYIRALSKNNCANLKSYYVFFKKLIKSLIR